MANYTEALKNFAGFDKDGNPVFADPATKEFSSLDKNEYGDLIAEAKTQYGDKKFDDYASDLQSQDIQKDKEFLGFDPNKSAVFRNDSGVIERATGSFSSGLQRQFGAKEFNKAAEGITNSSVGQNTNFNLAKRHTGVLGESKPKNTFQPPKWDFGTRATTQMPNFSPQTQQAAKPDYFQNEAQRKINDGAVQPKTAELKDNTQKDLAKTAYDNTAKDAAQKKEQELKSQANQISQPYVQQANALQNQGTQLVNQAKSYIPPEAQQAKGYYDTAQQIMADPQAYAKQQAIQYAKDNGKEMLQNLAGDYLPSGVGGAGISALLNSKQIMADPGKFARQQAQEQAKAAALSSASQAAFGGVDVSGVANALMGKGGDKGDASGRAAAMAAYSAATGGLGAVVNPQTLAMASQLSNKYADKLEDKGTAGQLAGTQLKTGAIATQGAADVGNEVLNVAGGLGSSAYKNTQADISGYKDAGKQLASGNIAGGVGGLAKTAVGSYVNAAKSSVENAKKLGQATANAGKITATATKDTAKAVGDGASTLVKGADKVTDKVDDKLGMDFFGSNKEAFKDYGSSIKKITSGDIASGLGGLGSTALKQAFNSVYQAPAQVAKRAAEAAKSVFSSIFCFTEETEILLADGKYKKAKDIKLGDKLMLGGEVTACGTSKSKDIVEYHGEKVSSGHAIFSDASEWMRVGSCPDARPLNLKEEILVYPISTEFHTIVTKGQIWADMEEVEDTFNKTDDQIIKELNSKTRRNMLLSKWVKSYKWK